MAPRVALLTLGCSKNRVDSEHLLRQLQAGGWQVLPTDVLEDPKEKEPLDALLINTCGFIQDAKMESIEAIWEAVQAKQEGKVRKVYVFGCLSGRYPSELPPQIPQVDGFFGANDIAGVAAALGVTYNSRFACQRFLTTPSHYAYLKLSEGCDRSCAYCAIPLIRGKHISRPADALLAEARNLAENGVKELILIAQDSSYYGLDLTGKRELASLMEQLCRIDGLQWIRVLYTYPQGFPLSVLDLMAKEPKICHYVDIPLQHISDKVLTPMRRNTTEKQTRELIENFRTRVPNICLRTTLMVGHPGEDREAFLRLMNFVSEARFERMGAFMYSEEEGTYGAKNLRDSVARKTKERRYAKLMELQMGISFAYNASRVGKTYPVLIDGVRDNFWVGRTSIEAPEVDGQVLIPLSEMTKQDVAVGQFAQVRITDANEYDLYGTFIK